MADYERVQIRFIISENSDYSNPKRDTKDELELTATPSYVKHDEISVPTGGMTLIEAGEWTSVSSLFVLNNGSYTVSIGYTDAAADAHVLDVLSGKQIYLTDVDPSVAVTLTADTAACTVVVWATGA